MLLLLACARGPDLPAEAAPTEGTTPTVDADTVRLQAPGLELHEQTWHVDDRSGPIWTARVSADAALRIAASDDARPLADLVAGEAGAWAAINGGFYDHGPMGLVVSDGGEHHGLSAGGGSGVVMFDPMPITVVHRDAWAAGALQALQSIDRLVDGGVALVKPKEGAHRDARSAIIVNATAVWLVAAVASGSATPTSDGVQLAHTAGAGLTLAEFAALLAGPYQAQHALNLDGAVSTQMLVATPEGRWVLHGERGTINGVIVRPR